jgi:hypothetical protein
MQDTLNNETPASILLEYARFLKDAAKVHDEEIKKIKDEEINELKTKIHLLELRINTIEVERKTETKDKNTGWTIAEKTSALVGFLIMVGLTIWGILRGK